MIRTAFLAAARVLWLLPGFLLWASFPPMAEKTDCLFALAPLLFLSRTASVRRSVAVWFANGLVFWLAGLSWMPAIVKNGGPWPLVVLGWFALAVYCALYFGAFGYLSARLWTWINRSGPAPWRKAPAHPYAWRLAALLVIEPALWAGLELVRSRAFGGFAWNQIGVVPVNGGFGASAALGGVYLASALVVLVNGTLASVAERMLGPFFAALRRPLPTAAAGLPRWVRTVETALPLALLWAVHSAGVRVTDRTAADADGTVNVAFVQRNAPSVFLHEPRTAYEIWREHRELLRLVAPFRPDLVVYAESALSEFGEIGSREAEVFAAAACAEAKASAVLAGGGRSDGGRLYNSAALYADGAVRVYDKVHLVPFGEFIPGDKLFPVLQKLAPVGSCTPGEPVVLPWRHPRGGAAVPLGVAICFEDTDSALVRTLAAKGARLLAFITNDTWFSASVEAEQHAWQAVARAVETGLPVVRVGNSGVTGAVSPDGTAQWLCDARGRPVVDEKGTMAKAVALPGERPSGAPRTPYLRWGDLPLAVVFALSFSLVLLVECKDYYEKRRYLSV